MNKEPNRNNQDKDVIDPCESESQIFKKQKLNHGLSRKIAIEIDDYLVKPCFKCLREVP